MADSTLLVASPLLMRRREAWAEGYALVEPADVARVSADLAGAIEVIVTAGDALDMGLVDMLPNLKLVACWTTGYEGIDVGHLRSREIALTTAAGANAHDVADHAIALFLAWWHGVPRADRAVRDGKWREGVAPRSSLRGKQAGIVGFGRIGSEIARRAEALGMTVGWWGPRAKPGAGYARAESIVALARESDVLFVASRATRANAGQIDREVLAALGSHGVLVNVSRGFLVDEPALIAALDKRTIAGAALDVFAEEPVDAKVWGRFDNVVLTPHVAGFTREGGAAMFAQLRENIRRYFAGEPLLTPVRETADD
jgi:hydroxypyruvate reductase